MNRGLRTLLIILVALASTVGATAACTCAAPATVEEALQKSSRVFRGRVVAIERALLDRLGLTRSGSVRVRFEVVKSWKGGRARTVTLTTRLSGEACGWPFQKGQEYLVYVAPSMAGLETGICTGTKSANGAATEMAALDRLSAAAAGPLRTRAGS